MYEGNAKSSVIAALVVTKFEGAFIHKGASPTDSAAHVTFPAVGDARKSSFSR